MDMKSIWGVLTAKSNEKDLRKKISQEIETKRAKYLELANDKQSEDYQFYLGICNGMNYAKVIVENPKND
jgi:hypothetical protein